MTLYDGGTDEFDEPYVGADTAWRGDQHLADWPEECAGPEYWLMKQDVDDPDDQC